MTAPAGFLVVLGSSSRPTETVTRGSLDVRSASVFPESIPEGRYGTGVACKQGVVRKKMLGRVYGIEAHPAEARLKAEERETMD